jgi:hypothetical protein
MVFPWGFAVKEANDRVAIMTTTWNASYLKDIARIHTDVLRLTSIEDPLGWPGASLEFLSQLPELQGLEILTRNKLDPGPIEQLKKLRILSLWCPLNSAIDLTQLPNLRSCEIAWSTKTESVSNCTLLETLLLKGFLLPRLDVLTRLSSLRRLKLYGARHLQSPESIGSVTAIEQLSLSFCPALVSLDGIQRVSLLKQLEIYSARRLTSIEPLRECRGLEKVTLENTGAIDSLAPLAHLVNLEEIHCPGVRVVDGDLSWALALPKLEHLSIRAQRHLVPSADAIQAALLNRKMRT